MTTRRIRNRDPQDLHAEMAHCAGCAAKAEPGHESFQVKEAVSPRAEPEQPKSRGKTAICEILQTGPDPVIQPEPAPASALTPATLARVVREALPEAESCGLGLEYLAAPCGADAEQVEFLLTSLGMTIFKFSRPFKGLEQRQVSVNKKLRAWAEQEGA